MKIKHKQLQVPDLNKLKSVQELCDMDQPYLVNSEMDNLFLKAMKESINWHSSKNTFYNNLLNINKFDIESVEKIEDLQKLPYIHANFFKTHEVPTVSKDDLAITLTSSGTTGQKSQMFFDEWSINSGRRMVDFVYDYYGWYNPDKKTNYIVSNYEPEAGSTRGTTNTSMFLTHFAPANDMFYLLRSNGRGGHEFDAFGAIEKLKEYEKQGLPVRVVGFPSFFYFVIKQMMDLDMEPLKLSEESLIFTAGGWKGYADQQISKKDFAILVEKQLGIPQHRCRDGYGSVEHSVPYIECSEHNLHIPIWSRAFIRDTKTREILGNEKPGFLCFLTPYITSVPAISVMMGDLAMIHKAEKCSCGLKTPFIEILGRAGISKNKSCAVSASELLKKESV
ncbi:MAG: acyl-protein synthase [Marinilabiliales bacterium]|nr:MAG: acyl-protein synthase [Marinilabiliales bacterium]